MFKKLAIMIMLAVSFSTFANSMSQDPNEKGFKLPSDISESRRHYEKQGRVTYAAQTTSAETTAAAPSGAAEPVEEPAKSSTPSKPFKPTKRSGGMRY